MKFIKSEPMALQGLMHINGHVSYLLTCDSKASDDPEGYAESNIIAFYKNGELNIVNGYDIKSRTTLAKEIRKLAKSSLINETDKVVKSKLRMALAYLEGLNNANLSTQEGFDEMARYIFSYIEEEELQAEINDEESFIYVFHLHQEQMPHIHRFYKIK